MLRRGSDEIRPSRASSENDIRNQKAVRHSLLELPAEKFKLLGRRPQSVQVVIDDDGLATRREGADLVPEGVLSSLLRCSCNRRALNAVIWVEENHIGVNGGAERRVQPFIPERGSVRDSASFRKPERIAVE